MSVEEQEKDKEVISCRCPNHRVPDQGHYARFGFKCKHFIKEDLGSHGKT